MASMAFANYKQRTAHVKILDQENHSFQERDSGVGRAFINRSEHKYFEVFSCQYFVGHKIISKKIVEDINKTMYVDCRSILFDNNKTSGS